MQKLTKEQCDWLIRSIDRAVEGRVISTNNISEAAKTVAQIRAFVQEAINQCTEKEFPKFGLDVHNSQRLYQRHLSIELDAVDAGGLLIRCESTYAVPVTFDQFKQFTDGCNKIVEWLNDT